MRTPIGFDRNSYSTSTAYLDPLYLCLQTSNVPSLKSIAAQTLTHNPSTSIQSSSYINASDNTIRHYFNANNFEIASLEFKWPFESWKDREVWQRNKCPEFVRMLAQKKVVRRVKISKNYIISLLEWKRTF